MTRVLLTGAAGFVGSHTLLHLLKNTDWDIVCPVSFNHKGNMQRIAQVTVDDFNAYADRIHLLFHDLRAPFNDQEINMIGNVDYIINMASESHVDRSILYPRSFVENNVQLQLTMLDLLRQLNTTYAPGDTTVVKKFIQVSTDEVFGAAAPGQDHKEGSPHIPSNPYSASKAMQEDLCVAYWRTYNLPIIITNTMNIIGEMQDNEKLVPRAIKCIKNGEVMPIYGNPDTKEFGTRKYLHARNQADALLFVLNNVDAKLHDNDTHDLERINIVGDTELTNLELPQLIAKTMGRELKYEIVDYHSSRPGHDLRYSLDGTKLAELGWVAPISFESSIKRIVDFAALNPTWLA